MRATPGTPRRHPGPPVRPSGWRGCAPGWPRCGRGRRAAARYGFKFFPAQAAGGTALLRALAGPFPQALFCPTGGIGRDNAADYLALPNVACVGGSWLTPADRIKAGDWDAVSALAREAAALAR